MLIKRIDSIAASVLLISLTLVTFLQVLFRFVLQAPLDWSEEASRYFFIMLVYLAATIATRDGTVIRIELIDFIIKTSYAIVLNFFINLISAGFLFYVAFLSIFLVKNAFTIQQVSPALGIPMWVLYLLQSILFALGGIRYLLLLINILIEKKVPHNHETDIL